ncbi:MAG TPA: glycosyltransferase family 39 protein [Anaerolineales bacterium]|nr:glycosyltransferase family 39 protein [Anaerolineales bacterium]
MKHTFTKYWPWFFFTAAFESLLAILALLWLPSESGLSMARLGLLGVLFAFFCAGFYGGWIARQNPTRFEKLASTPAIIFTALLFLTSGLVLFLLRYLNPERLLPYYERLSPLLWYLLIVSLQSSIFFLLHKNGFHPQDISARRPVYVSALIAFAFLFSVFVFVAITKLGITKDTAYWGEPGVAIIGWQFMIALLAGFGLLVYSALNPSPSVGVTNYILPLTLYLTAAALWLSVPVDVLQNSFYSPITPPANTPFPYSDAGFYDYLAQSLLLGTGYLNSIPPRPFYVFFLAILHFLFGQDYSAIITAQTLVLAFFPVSLYFLAKKLHTSAAGVTVALFAIFRELTGLWISSNTRVANSKIFTTDFPTAMALTVLCLVLIWWLERRDFKSTLIAGGFFGLVLLFRTQSLLVLPVVFVLAWFAFQRKTKEWVMAGFVFAIAMVLTVLPWLTHNYTVIGQFTFDDPRQSAIIYSQYSFTGNLDLSQFDPAKESVGHRIVTFTLENPTYVAGFITNHILNTEIGGLLALPLIERFDGLLEPVNLYWVSWDGSLTWYNLVLLLVYLAVIAVGFGVSWRRWQWIGLVPLAVNLGYVLANGISRFSSWRYNLPVDWVIYFYFAIGVVEILGGLFLLFGVNPFSNLHAPSLSEQEPRGISFRDLRPQFAFFLLAFMFVGALPWFARGLAQPRYTAPQSTLLETLITRGHDSTALTSFLSQPNAVLLEGQLLYPRMFRRGEGMASMNPWPAYAIRDYSRIGSILLNDTRSDLIFVTKDLLNFQHGADAIVLACQTDEGYFNVRLIDFGETSFQSAPLMDPCPEN